MVGKALHESHLYSGSTVFITASRVPGDLSDGYWRTSRGDLTGCELKNIYVDITTSGAHHPKLPGTAFEGDVPPF
jgi:hypothetical protein